MDAVEQRAHFEPMDAVEQRAHFDTFGYVLIPGCIDPDPITSEVRQALVNAFGGDDHLRNRGPAGNSFRYVPMMTERTPISLSLVTALAHIAADLLDQPVLPGRSKGTRYAGSTSWHRDSKAPVQSLGMLCYLEPLSEETGALRVVPGSNRWPSDATIECDDDSRYLHSALHLATTPGDVIVVDEHLFHSSSGGTERLQWRVDFVSDRGSDDSALTRYFAGQHVVGWDGGYDVDLFPSYGPAWRDLDGRWTRRLADLGVFELARAEEQFVRDERRRRAN